ncbi:MAG: 3-deoxy-7-phosphoheptulonate synthase [Ruminococcaceae bacterium]|nr:3-deoxy-7-phosphoheptulonate synthase [Oscillospiraceae bacterium]
MSLEKDTKILIVGLGVMGGGYAKALTDKGYSVAGITRSQKTLDYALAHGIVSKGAAFPDSALISEAELIVIALYPQAAIDWVAEHGKHIRKGALVTDVTGVKVGVVEKMQALMPEGVEYISAHPMAGRESSGIEYSDPRVFLGANYIVTPTEKNSEEAIELCADLGRVLGFGRISVLPPEKHDSMIAFLSQLTHCIAVTLMTCNQSEGMERYSGDSFRDLTRIAKINDRMWSELFLANKTPLLKEMDCFMEEFKRLRTMIAEGNTEDMRAMMRLSTERRTKFDKPKSHIIPEEKEDTNMSMNFNRKLPIPMEIKEQYPVTPELEKTRDEQITELKKIFTGESDKFALIIGPCSADHEDTVIKYIHNLREVQEKVKDKILIVPRIYTNKPRTTGAGYKGMLHQPDPNSDPDMLKGIIAIRDLHIRAMRETGFACADEMLYPENHRYLSDLLAYVAVGARSVENQQHRLTASGMDIPVGMKNPTGGDLSVMMNSITAAQGSHTFLYRGWEVKSDGNPFAHAILRGYVDKRGVSHPNYHYEDLVTLHDLYAAGGQSNPAVIVDTNHANSGKRYLEQPRIAKDVLHSCNCSADIRKLVKGLMIESYIYDGCQKISEDEILGKSITDPCLGWEKTERLIYDIADML